MKRMITVFRILIISFLFFLYACNNNKNLEKSNSDSAHVMLYDSITETHVASSDTSIIQEDSLFVIELPLFDSITTKTKFRDTLLAYFNQAFLNPLDSEVQIQRIFSKREKLLEKVYSISSNFEENNPANSPKWQVFEKELNIIGFQPVYAEGMLTSISIKPILQKQIKTICSAEYQLYLDFLYAEANSLGGEYPYMDLSHHVEMILLGEKMETKYSKSTYNDSIKDIYHFSLKCLTDIHSLYDNATDQYLLDGISIDFWPNATNITFMEQFVKKHSNSKFAKAIKKILVNTSRLELSQDPNKDQVYLIVIDSFGSEKEASNKVFEYLSKGIDIPHVIYSKKAGKESYHTVYRFYSNKKKAEEMLKSVKPKYKTAKLLRIDFNWNELA